MVGVCVEGKARGDAQVFPIMIFAFSIRLGELTAIDFSRMKPGTMKNAAHKGVS